MPIEETPKIKLKEGDNEALRSGDGAEIPIFISATGNETPASNILQFKKYEDAKNLPNASSPGIGVAEGNYLLPILKDFFEENEKINSDDLSAPYVYVKDLGTATPSTAASWTNIIPSIKIKKKVQVEAYVFKKTEGVTLAQIEGIMNSVAEVLQEEFKKCRPRIAYFTILGLTDAELQDVTDKTKASFIQNKWVGFVEPHKFGKHIARICCTPYYDEPGYYKYRSVNPGEFIERTEQMEEDLQDAGVIFGHDEQPDENIYPKINLAVSTAFAADPNEREPGSLLHELRNTNQLLRDAVSTVYPQLKRRETEVYLSEVQADLDLLVTNKIKSGYMKPGTSIIARETEEKPYKLAFDVHAYPVNSTQLIEFTAYIE